MEKYTRNAIWYKKDQIVQIGMHKDDKNADVLTVKLKDGNIVQLEGQDATDLLTAVTADSANYLVVTE